MEEIHELLGYQHLKIIQNEDMFSFSVDAMLLANFIEITSKSKKIVELGCGNGPILLFLTLKTKAQLLGIEIQEEVADMARRSIALNKLESQISVLTRDMKNIHSEIGANLYNIVICNPPYFKCHDFSHLNKNAFLTIARHEIKITLTEVITEAKKLLIDGGLFYMVHRSERLIEIIEILSQENFEIKRMQFVYSKTTDETAQFVLIEAKKNAKKSVKVIKPLYIYDNHNQYTEEVRKIFNFQGGVV